SSAMTGMAASFSGSATKASSSSAGARRTPTLPSWRASASDSPCQRPRLTITLPAGGSGSPSWIWRHASSVSARFLMICIESLLEGLHAHPSIAVDEAFIGRGPLLEVDLQHGVDGIDDLLAREGRSDDLADRGVIA